MRGAADGPELHTQEPCGGTCMVRALGKSGESLTAGPESQHSRRALLGSRTMSVAVTFLAASSSSTAFSY